MAINCSKFTGLTQPSIYYHLSWFCELTGLSLGSFLVCRLDVVRWESGPESSEGCPGPIVQDNYSRLCCLLAMSSTGSARQSADMHPVRVSVAPLRMAASQWRAPRASVLGGKCRIFWPSYVLDSEVPGHFPSSFSQSSHRAHPHFGGEG